LQLLPNDQKAKASRCGPWAKEKLDALRQYLEFYTLVLKNQRHWLQGTIFIDAFAGPGLSRVRTKAKQVAAPDLLAVGAVLDEQEIEYLKGSPRQALEIANPFDSYIFIDRNPDNAAELRALAKVYAGQRAIEVQEHDANSALRSILARNIDWRHHRAVVFLDPFGMQVPWGTIDSLARTGAIEVIINFPLGMAIQRLLTRSGEIPEGWRISLDSFSGSSEWRDLAYEEREDLFGVKRSKVADSGLRLLEWYRGRLKKSFGHVSTARLIKNTRGNPLYYLIWAGPNKKGLEGADYILSKGERVAVRVRRRR
jgi:three-Cys-motif partner protein